METGYLSKIEAQTPDGTADMGERSGLRVHMFSAYSIEFNGQPVNIMRGSSTKVLQLLAMLLLGGEKGLPKREMIGNVYGQGQERGADPNRNLNNLLYRLKKQLAVWGIDGATISLEGGFARLSADFPVEVDAVLFERKAAEAFKSAGAQRTALLKEAMGIYTGEFLEEFCTELWVIQKDQELKRQYFSVVETLGKEYEQAGNMLAARDVYHNASLLFPFESWQLCEMDCLIALKDYTAAYYVYQNTERLYDEELGIMPGEEYKKRLDVIEENAMRPFRRLSDIADTLRGDPKDGAYYCYYPDFIDSCQILSRIAERSGQSLYLLLCTWSAKGVRAEAEKRRIEGAGKERPDDAGMRLAGEAEKERPDDAGMRLPGEAEKRRLSETEKRRLSEIEKRRLEEEQMAILKDTIAHVFRKGDIFTKYSRCQYLVILSGTGRENGVRAFERLRNAWRKRDGVVGDLSYSMDSLLGFRETKE